MLLGGPFASPEMTAHFSREVKMIARLRHPGIVAVYETGEIDGVRFFTMELVEGRTLASLVRDGPLDALHASAYTRKAALAVEHAHGQHVLHRDLKPSNILIDLTGDPKVADFGLARVWSVDAESTTNLSVMGSPPYMAPEQVSGTPDNIGPAADIYALGAVLYHLLTGRPPHQGSRIEDVLAQVRKTPPVAPRLLNSSVPRDLETICLKCLEKDPSRRYRRAADLAEDLQRFEQGEPVLARPVGAWGRAWRWSRRNRSLAAALVALAGVLVAGAVAVALQAAHNRNERERLELATYATGMHAASIAMGEGNFPLARRYLNTLAPTQGQVDRRGFEWRLLWELTAPQAENSFQPHKGEIEQIAFSPDGRRLVSNSFDNTVNSIDLADGGHAVVGIAAGGGWALAFEPGGKSLYVGVGAAEPTDFSVRLAEAGSGRILWSTPGYQISLSKDGARAAVGRGQPFPWVPASGGVEIWDAVTHRLLRQIEGDYRASAISPDAKTVALAPADDTIRVRGTDDSRKEVTLSTKGPQAAVAYSPDGSLLASCGLGEASLWRTSDYSRVADLPHPWLRVWSVAFSPDGKKLATACSDRAVRVWNTDDGRCLLTLRGHADEVWSVAFSPDGRTLASGGKDGSVLLWRVNPTDHPADITYRGWSRPLYSPDGKSLVLAKGYAEPCALIRLPGRTSQDGPKGWAPAGVSADGADLLLWSSDKTPALRWWKIASSEFGNTFEGAEPISGLAQAQTGISGDRRTVYQLGRRSELKLWEQKGGAPIRSIVLPPGSSAVRSAALSRDAKWFAWSRMDGYEFWLADVATGRVRVLAGHRNTISNVVFSPSGNEVASASADGSVRLWSCRDATTIAVFSGHPESVDDVAFSPDGRTLASLGALQSVKFWHLPTLSETLSIEMPEAGGFLAFSPDGTTLAVTLADREEGGDKGARIFEAPLSQSQ